MGLEGVPPRSAHSCFCFATSRACRHITWSFQKREPCPVGPAAAGQGSELRTPHEPRLPTPGCLQLAGHLLVPGGPPPAQPTGSPEVSCTRSWKCREADRREAARCGRTTPALGARGARGVVTPRTAGSRPRASRRPGSPPAGGDPASEASLPPPAREWQTVFYFLFTLPIVFVQSLRRARALSEKLFK